MFVIIKKGEIVKSKLHKTNQGPQLVLIYYKLILFIKRIFFRRNLADEAYRLISQSDVPKTVCANYVLSWLFTDSNHQTQTERKEGSKNEAFTSTVKNLNVNLGSSSKGALTNCVREQKNIQRSFSVPTAVDVQ